MNTISHGLNEKLQAYDILSKLKIGDYVNYKPKSSLKKYNVLSKYSGYSKDQEIEVEDLGGWRILNINEQNGTVDLISENITSGIYLVGAQGYNNGVYLLNDLCEKIYSNENLKAVARSLNVLDIQEHLINGSYWEQYEGYGIDKEFTEGKSYPSQWIQDNNDRRNISLDNKYSENRNLIEEENKISFYENGALKIKGTYWTIDKSTLQTSAFKTPAKFNKNSGNNVYYELMFTNDDGITGKTWLATRYVDTREKHGEGKAVFGLHLAWQYLQEGFLIHSKNWAWGEESVMNGGGIRPIVNIPAKYIDVNSNASDGKSRLTAWEIGNDEKSSEVEIRFSEKNMFNAVLNQIKGKYDIVSDINNLSFIIQKKDLNSIKTLELNNNEIVDIGGLNKFTELEELNLSNNNIENVAVLTNLSKLKRLTIYGNKIKSIEPINELTKLEYLSISKNYLDDRNYSKEKSITSMISNLTNLKELDLSHNFLLYTTSLGNLKNLRTLNLYDNAINDLNGLVGLNKIESLNLGANNDRATQSIANLSVLNSLTTLKELNFSENYTSEIVNNIYNLNKLEKLYLQKNKLSDPNISKISSLTKLKVLDLYGNYLCTITPFTQLTKLEEFDIQRNLIESLNGILKNNSMVWPNIKKLNIANNQIKNSNNEIEYLCKKSENKSLELDYENIINTEKLPHVDKNGTKYVTYEDFGARCDGSYDDFIAIKNAHNYANENKFEVRAGKNKEYHIFKYNDEPVYIKTNVDWNNSTFIIHDERIEEKLGRFKQIFVINNVADIKMIQNPTWTINKTTKKITEIEKEIEGLNKKGYSKYLCVVENSNKKQFMRYGYGANTGDNQQDRFIIDNECNVLNDIVWDFEKITNVKIYGIPNEQLTIKNGNFTTNSFESESMSGRLYNAPNKGMYYNRGLLFNECCNVSVSNVNHTITNDTLSGTYYGFLDFNTCANAEIDNCNLFARKYNGGGRSTYDLVIDKCVNIRCNNITTNDILAHDRWGFHKTQYAKDLTFENCNINNVDAHEGVCNLTIKNSKIGAKKVDVTGFGTMNIIDTEILGDALLGLRGDYGAFWDGDVNIINCTYTHNSQWAWVLFKSDLSFFEESNPFDFGYEIKMPNIYVENLTLNNENIPNEEKLLMFGIWNKELGKKIPADYWPERIYINGVKFINNNSKNPHIELAPVELKNLKEDCVKIDI